MSRFIDADAFISRLYGEPLLTYGERLLIIGAIEDYCKFTNSVITIREKSEMEKVDLSDLELSVRSFNTLKRNGYNTLADIIKLTPAQIMKMRNMGRKSMEEIMRVIGEKRVEYGQGYNDLLEEEGEYLS